MTQPTRSNAGSHTVSATASARIVNLQASVTRVAAEARVSSLIATGLIAAGTVFTVAALIL